MANFTPQEIEEMLQEFFNVVGKRQYTGARYVPVFGRRGESSITWDNSAPYEPLTIVLYQGNSYTSRQYVPEGVDITDAAFWANTGNYNAQVEQYRNEVLLYKEDVDQYKEDVEDAIDAINDDIEHVEEIADSMASKNDAFNSTDYGPQLDPDYETYVYPNLINWGALNEAPFAKPQNNSGIDVIAHWYNDFGLMRTALSPNQGQGSYAWYDWRWNFPINATNPPVPTYVYDPAREPLFGFYNGDNSRVLDWICYWLIESGVNVVCLTGAIASTENWAQPEDNAYWRYQLLNNVKNFKSLKYILQLCRDTNNRTYTDSDIAVTISVAKQYDNIYTYKVNGRNMVVFFIWDMTALRGAYDNYNGATQTIAKLNAISDEFISEGYDGCIFLARNLNETFFTNYVGFDSLKPSNKFCVLRANYSTRYQNDVDFNYQYSNYANSVVFSDDDYEVNNIVTAAKSQAPHPSTWNLQGTTPELFQRVAQRAIDDCIKKNKPKMITIYNVSEWAEGGPGLIPNKKDGFGYLNALRSVLVKNAEPLTVPNLIITEAVNEALKNDKRFYRAYNDRNVTGETETIEIPLNNLYNYQDSLDDYNSYVTLRVSSTGSSFVPKITYFHTLNFGTKRCYVYMQIDNWADKPSDTAITVRANLMIIGGQYVV